MSSEALPVVENSLYPTFPSTISWQEESGWDNFGKKDLKEVLFGSERLTGYFLRNRALDLRKLGIDTTWWLNDRTLESYDRWLGRRFLVDHWGAYSEYCEKRRICLLKFLS